MKNVCVYVCVKMSRQRVREGEREMYVCICVSRLERYLCVKCVIMDRWHGDMK